MHHFKVRGLKRSYNYRDTHFSTAEFLITNSICMQSNHCIKVRNPFTQYGIIHFYYLLFILVGFVWIYDEIILFTFLFNFIELNCVGCQMNKKRSLMPTPKMHREFWWHKNTKIIESTCLHELKINKPHWFHPNANRCKIPLVCNIHARSIFRTLQSRTDDKNES